MAVQQQSINEFLELARTYPVLDVRSPGEFTHAHIPGAHSLPLFSDAERAAIGTAYKQDSREAAIKIGLDAFGPKMRGMVEAAEKILSQKTGSAVSDKKVLVHCWRGGMRSEAVAWLLGLYGFDVQLLTGGYKAYRQWIIRHWQQPGQFRILGGFTGAGKTPVLAALDKLGEPVLDLEGLARHKGSAFGGLDKIPQPSQEMFENLLGTEIHLLRKQFGEKPIWIEDESQRIGDLNIPVDLFRGWSTAPLCFLDISFEARLDHISAEYGKHSTESLINAIVRIKKRLGPLETKTAIAFLLENDIKECFRILLQYYDKHYKTPPRPREKKLEGSGMNSLDIARAIQHYFL